MQFGVGVAEEFAKLIIQKQQFSIESDLGDPDRSLGKDRLKESLVFVQCRLVLFRGRSFCAHCNAGTSIGKPSFRRFDGLRKQPVCEISWDKSEGG
jgi:hypothetical protein